MPLRKTALTISKGLLALGGAAGLGALALVVLLIPVIVLTLGHVPQSYGNFIVYGGWYFVGLGLTGLVGLASNRLPRLALSICGGGLICTIWAPIWKDVPGLEMAKRACINEGGLLVGGKVETEGLILFSEPNMNKLPEYDQVEQHMSIERLLVGDKYKFIEVSNCTRDIVHQCGTTIYFVAQFGDKRCLDARTSERKTFSPLPEELCIAKESRKFPYSTYGISKRKVSESFPRFIDWTHRRIENIKDGKVHAELKEFSFVDKWKILNGGYALHCYNDHWSMKFSQSISPASTTKFLDTLNIGPNDIIRKFYDNFRYHFYDISFDLSLQKKAKLEMLRVLKNDEFSNEYRSSPQDTDGVLTVLQRTNYEIQLQSKEMLTKIGLPLNVDGYDKVMMSKAFLTKDNIMIALELLPTDPGPCVPKVRFSQRSCYEGKQLAIWKLDRNGRPDSWYLFDVPGGKTAYIGSKGIWIKGIKLNGDRINVAIEHESFWRTDCPSHCQGSQTIEYSLVPVQ